MEKKYYELAAKLFEAADSDDIYENLSEIQDSCTEALMVYDTDTQAIIYIGLQSGSVLHPKYTERYIFLTSLPAGKIDEGLEWYPDLFNEEEYDIIEDQYDGEYTDYLADHPEKDTYAERCGIARKFYWEKNWRDMKEDILGSLRNLD